MTLDVNVVILGGCGFLGQHVLAELLTEKEKMAKEAQEARSHDDDNKWLIKDIKVLDVKPFNEECLTGQREDAKTVNYQLCDICNIKDLKEELKGASAVINCAAITPDFQKDDLGCGDKMQQVNVEGTRNVIKACKELGVKALVHTSSVSVKMGGKRLIEHTETLTPDVSEDELVLGDYARGRLKAEQMVLEAHGATSENGSVTLRTIALRPPLLYGEGDTNFVPVIYSLAKACGNRFPSIGNPKVFTQAAYAGNIAVAHIHALKHLLTDEGRSSLVSCGGLPVYVTDDSPPNNIIDLTSPFLSHADLEPSSKNAYWTTSLYLYWTGVTNRIKSTIGLSTDGKEPTAVPSWPLHQFAGTITVVSRMRAELCLGYSPIYKWEQALKRSNIYYSRQLT